MNLSPDFTNGVLLGLSGGLALAVLIDRVGIPLAARLERILNRRAGRRGW